MFGRQDGSLYILRDHRIQNKTVFPSEKIDFVLANISDPDEMPHHATFHLGLHCLQLNLCRHSSLQGVKYKICSCMNIVVVDIILQAEAVIDY